MGSSAGVGWQVRKRPSFGNGNRIRYKKSLAASRKSCSSKRAQQSKCRVDLKIAKPLVHSGDEAYALEAQLHRMNSADSTISLLIETHCIGDHRRGSFTQLDQIVLIVLDEFGDGFRLGIGFMVRRWQFEQRVDGLVVESNLLTDAAMNRAGTVFCNGVQRTRS